jgi:energy-coupling factor transporter ATP-binding protein EcfA2
MSRAVLILGESGAGKSTSIRTLNPEETIVINSLGKDLPFKGSSKLYTPWDKEKNPNGNMIKTSHSASVIQWLNFINQKMPHIKNVIIDDNTHQSSLEYMRRISEKSFDKFNDIAANMVNIAETAKSLRDDLVVFILHHITETGDGVLEDKKIKAMTIGKLVNEKLGSYEAFFTVILLAKKSKNADGKLEHFFLTQDADSTTKSPIDMFMDEKIPNDLQLVRDTITKYYDEQ